MDVRFKAIFDERDLVSPDGQVGDAERAVGLACCGDFEVRSYGAGFNDRSLDDGAG